MIGTRVGPYEISSRIGEGGMGHVYRAIDTRLKREVAIKVLAPAFTEDTERLNRFEREAQLLAQLNHPHIASVFGVEESGSVRALVMELVEGEDLSQRIAPGPLPVAEAVPIALQIAEALEGAHERGIVHRDLKPANVKIRADGTVKVLDFGLAKALESAAPRFPLPGRPGSAAPPDALTLTSNGTQAGVILGTVAYMSPEQARGIPVDQRADIWAFGVVLFEMVSGRRPFDGDSASEVLASVLRAEPDWSALPRELSPAIRSLLGRCLVRDLRRRLQSIAEARIVLEDALGTESPPAESPTRAGLRSRRRELVAWALATAALLGLATTLGLKTPNPAGPPRPAVAPRFAISPPAFGGFEGGIAVSRDGSRLAFVAPGRDGEDVLWLRPLSEVVPRPLPGTEGASYPFWSPDGSRLAFFAKGMLKTLELSGGRVQSLCAAPKPRGGSWSRQGTLLLSIHAGGTLIALPATGGDPTPVVVPQGDPNAGTFRFPSFLPDGRHFLCYRFGGSASAGLWVGSVGSNEMTYLVESDSGAVFAEPGHLLYRSRERLIAQPFDPTTARLRGAGTAVAEDVWADSTATMLTALDASNTGTVVFRTGGPARSRLSWFDRNGNSLGEIGPPGSYLEPAISPDGRRIAVSRSTEGSGSDIWVFEVDRGGLTRFTFGDGSSSTPLWSPDGKHLAWAAFPSGQVLIKASNGTGKAEPLWKNAAFWPLSDWSNDGRHIFFEVLEFRRFQFDIGRVAVQGSHDLEPLLAESYSELGARLSRDGKWLVYVSDESGVEEVYVRSYPGLGERWQVSSAGGTQPRWRGDGRELYYVAPDRRIMAVEVTTEPRFEPGHPRPLFQTRILPPVEARNHYDVSLDGSRFVVNSRLPDDATAPIVVVLDWTSELGRR